MNTITIDQVMSWDPCYSREKILGMTGGREEMSVLDILRLETASLEDRLWLVLRPEVLGKALYREAGFRCVEHVLPIYEARYPNDNRPRAAIETARRYEKGESTKQELEAALAAAEAALAAARDAAWAVAWAVAWEAAWVAAWAVERAAWDAAWVAAWAVAWDAEHQWQVDMVIGLLEEDEKEQP